MLDFSYSYFSGANVAIKINNSFLDCAGISYKLLSSKQPIYSHYSPRYDMLSTSRQIIQGSFVINYTEADYLYYHMIDDPVIYHRIKDITTQYDNSEVRHNGYYLQYNNAKSFDIEIDFGKNNTTILKNCYITSRSQTINIDDSVILEEFSFVAREIKIKENSIVKENSEIIKKGITKNLKPSTIPKVKLKSEKPLVEVIEESVPETTKSNTKTAETPTVEKKVDEKTIETKKQEEVNINGNVIPVEKPIAFKTTKTELDGSIAQKVQLIKENLKAMKKILNDAEAKFNPDGDLTDESFKKNKYIFDEFKRMTGGIPPTSRFIPTDMTNQVQLEDYYRDGAEFVETLVVRSNSLTEAPFNDIDPNTLENGILNDYFQLNDVKKQKTISHDQYLAAINTLVLSNSVMLPVSIGEISTIANTMLNPKAQPDDNRIDNMINYNKNKVNNFIESYNDIKDKDKFTLSFLGSLSDKDWSEILPTDTLKPSAFTNLGMAEKDFEKYKRQFNSSNLSINDFMKSKTKSTDLIDWNPNINDTKLNRKYYPYYLFNNFYDSYATSNNNSLFYKDKSGLSEAERQILNNRPWSLISENQEDYERNPLEFFNRINYYDLNENSNTRYSMEEFLSKIILFQAPNHKK